MTDIEDLARRIKAIEDRVGSRNATQIDSSSVDVGDDDSLVVSDVVSNAAQAVAFDIPGLQDLLDTNAQQLQDAAAAVQEAMDAADAATEAGLAAGEEASQAADDALEKAQEALDAAAAAGGGATYTGRAPTADDPGVSGQQWFVWDSNYKITAYYVYNADTSQWVQTEITDAVLGNIDAGSITSGYIGAERIAAASLTAAVFAADAITSREIAADAILARNIKAAEITGAKIAAATITGGNIAANTITAGNIQAGTITANEIAAGAITATKLSADAINGKTISGITVTGGTFKTATSGQRLEMLQQRLDLYGTSTTTAASLYGTTPTDSGNSQYTYLTAQVNNTAGSGLGVFSGPQSTSMAKSGGAYSELSDFSWNVALSHGIVARQACVSRIAMGPGTSTTTVNFPFLEPDATTGMPTVYTGNIRYLTGSSTAPFHIPLVTPNPSNTKVAEVTANDFRATATTDLSLSSTEHAFQIGPDNGTNLAMDNNEIMVRNNGGTSSLFIQGDGGNVGLGNSSSTVSIPGSLNYGGSILPIIQRGNGTYSGGNIAGNRGNVTVTINFPQTFSTVPTVVPISANSRILATISSVSTTQVQILLLNYTDTTVTSSVNYQWVAFGS